MNLLIQNVATTSKSMRLDQELVVRKLCESRTEAQELINSGFVFVDGIVCTKQTKQVNDSAVIVVTSRRKFVSRGGDKLLGILHDVIGDDSEIDKFCAGKSALDIGSSTGGFTDCLLTYGVAHVDAVDVGTAQLHSRLQSNDRVSLYENTDIRKFTSTTTYSIIVADLSFIPLENIFNGIITFGTVGTSYFLLIKPQFEVGKGNTKKGIVKDNSLVEETLNKYNILAKERGLTKVSVYPCHLEGSDGNQEYFLYGVKV